MLNIITNISSDRNTPNIEIRHQKEPYIHAKILMIDPEEMQSKMYLGSCNFLPQNLDISREIGIILDNKHQISIVLDQFKSDWNGSAIAKNN